MDPMCNKCKIIVIENSNSLIKNYTQLFNFILKVRIVASRGQIPKDEIKY